LIENGNHGWRGFFRWSEDVLGAGWNWREMLCHFPGRNTPDLAMLSTGIDEAMLSNLRPLAIVRFVTLEPV